ncbi:MAG: potassium transporter TrkG [Oscillospiraceae bacterium]
MPIIHRVAKPFQPTRTIVLSFLGVIIVGTLLLCMPFSSRSGEFTNVVDALFTATSATCVTGLIVFDTYTYWTPLGQGIILALIQVGGIGLVTFASFFNFAIGKKLGLRTMQLASESSSSSGFNDVRQIVSVIVKMSLAFEGIGALLLMLVFIPKYGLHGLMISIFLAVSAFCNAGFDILGFEGEYVSLTNYADNPIVMVTIMALITCGGLGFVVWHDIAQYRKTKKLILHTKVVLITTGVIIAIGTVILLILEWNNPDTLGGMTFMQKLSRALFQTVTFRTCGFNTIDCGAMHSLSKITGIIIMFIGAAPGSTGGGIKVTTMAVIVMTVVCVIKNRSDTQILGRKIDKDVVYKSLAITALAAVAVVVTTITLIYANSAAKISGVDSLFESVSAFATVGVSVGPTAVVNELSLLVLSLTMFLGRVGPLSLALSLSMGSEIRAKKEVVPEGRISVG